MSVKAFILIQAQVGTAARVAQTVGAMANVLSSDVAMGPYDVIVQAEADDMDELGQMVVSKVQMIDGVDRTLLCPVVHI